MKLVNNNNLIMNNLSEEQIAQILFDPENQPHQLGKLIWNGNELVFSAYPNIGVAGIANNMPEQFGKELAKRFNSLLPPKPSLSPEAFFETLTGSHPGYWIKADNFNATMAFAKAYAASQSNRDVGELAEGFKKFVERVMSISEEQGRNGCTYGDTDFDSISVAYGYNECLRHIKEEAEQLLKKYGDGILE